MEKVLSLAPLPASFITEMFKMRGADVDAVNASGFSPEQIMEAVKDADYIIGDFTFQRRITREIAGAARKVKLIQQPSVGYQHIDVAACRELGIPVANTAGANTIAVAEHTVMMALCLLKNLLFAGRTTAEGQWRQMDVRAVELFGKTWGFIGFGRIGKAVAERLIPFGSRMIYFDPFRLSDADEKRWRISPVSLEDLLKTSDVISLHCPLTDETNGLLGRDNLALLKPGAVIINVARGEVIDEAALAEALRAGTIGGAALDVFCGEPINASHPLVGAAGDKVILTPHIAGVSQEAQGRILTMTIDNIIRVMRGREPENKVN